MPADRSLFSRLIARLSVSRKLMLIYVLDLTAVIYICAILISEKFIAIDFARKEVQGNAYIAALREPLVDAARGAAGDDAALARLPDAARAAEAAEGAHGEGLATAEPASRLVRDLLTLHRAATPERADAAQAVLASGREVVTRVGNQSNLILDPDLDSYYTMSLAVLRYPELLEQVRAIGRQVRSEPGGRADEFRTRHLIEEGRLDATARALASDHAEAYAVGGVALKVALSPAEAALVDAIEAFRREAGRVVETRLAAPGGPGPEGLAAALSALGAAERRLLDRLAVSWSASSGQLDRLLHARIEMHFQRMWLHLGTSLALLLAILATVTFVARQISRPLKSLSGVADEVRRSGDHALRARWDSQDEIGRLVQAFNDMLAQLDRERELQKELAASARAAEAQRELVQNTPIALMVTAIPGHEVLHANPPAEVWLAGCRRDPWMPGLSADQRSRFFQQLSDRGRVDEFEVHWKLGEEPAWAVLSARRVRFQGHDAVLTAFAPINHLKLMERRLALWAKVFEASSEAIVIVDAEGRLLSANRAFTRHTGHELQDVVGELPTLVFGAPLERGSALWQAVARRGTWQGELVVRRRNGTEYPGWLMVSTVRQTQGDVSHHILTSIDITDRKRSEQRIRFLAEHDVLTELPNRSLASERLRMAMQQAQRSGQRVAVVFIDLDRFKDINDSLGHHIGDGLLRSVARRLLEAVRTGDTVCRLGGDEFFVVLSGVAHADEAADIVNQRLIPLVRQPHAVDGAELHVSCSAGIAMYPDDATDLDTLMRHADTAMYEAKAAGRDAARFFTAAMTERAQARMRLEARLRVALESGSLSLQWQPVVDAHTRQPVAVEGLLRWHDEELGAVSPANFVPLAEETGLIVPIGAWVIDEACRQLAAWRAAGVPPLTVAINLSARQLGDAGLAACVQAALERHAVPAGQLELELTESMLMTQPELHRQRLQALRALGVRIAIDDFGTGYSSLAYLSRFPLDKLKVDRSFVHEMLGDANARAIVRAVIGLGRTLGLKVVAEGVETEAEAQALCEAQCDALQGYLFARPMPAAALADWMAGRVAQGVPAALPGPVAAPAREDAPA